MSTNKPSHKDANLLKQRLGLAADSRATSSWNMVGV